MIVASVKISPGLKNETFAPRFWQAGNLALWAMSPPNKRCFIVDIKNYDYVSLKVKKITISTGDERENFVLKNEAEEEPLTIIPVAGNHKWVIDAMPIFYDIACALQEDQFNIWNKKSKLIKTNNNEEEIENSNAKNDGDKLKWYKKIPLRFQRFCQKFLDSTITMIKQTATKTKPNPKTLLEKNNLKNNMPIIAEMKIWLIAIEDYIEEMMPERLVKAAYKTGEAFIKIIKWNVNFFKNLPFFIVKMIWLMVKKSSAAVWRGLKKPFQKFSPIKLKKFQAIIEFQNGIVLKSKHNIGVTYLFIEEKIMPLMFEPDELRPPPPSSNEFLDPCLELLQIDNQAG